MNNQKLTYYRLLLLQLNKISTAMIYCLTIIIGLMFFVFWFFFLYQPMQKILFNLNLQLHQADASLLINNKIDEKEGSIKNQLKSAEQQCAQLFKQSVAVDNNLLFLDNAQSIGFECKAYLPQKIMQKKWYSCQTAKMELVGSYTSLENVLELLSKSPLICQRLMIQRLSPDSLLVQLELMSLKELSK